MGKNKFKFKTPRYWFGAIIGFLLLVFGINSSLNAAPTPETVMVSSKIPLVHLASNDSFDVTDDGIKAAKLMLEAINGNQDSAMQASRIYDEIIFKENFGGDYTALQWFARYFNLSEEQQGQVLADPYVAGYYRFFADNNYANLKEYINRKYKLVEFNDRYTPAARDREAFLEDFIRFNNPRREEWERTSKVLEALNIKPGEKIIDIGSGPGYYSFKFAKSVGDTGKVYAIDTVQDHVNYVTKTSQQNGMKNVEAIKTDGETLNIPEKADRAFMCSLYHIIYTVSRENARDKYLNSIREALKPGGTFVIVDNAPVEERNTLPYQGPHIAKELIIGQLKYYGFTLAEEYSFIPQRYVLVFKKV